MLLLNYVLLYLLIVTMVLQDLLNLNPRILFQKSLNQQQLNFLFIYCFIKEQKSQFPTILNTQENLTKSNHDVQKNQPYFLQIHIFLKMQTLTQFYQQSKYDQYLIFYRLLCHLSHLLFQLDIYQHFRILTLLRQKLGCLLLTILFSAS